MAVFFIHRLFYVLANPLNRITAATDNTRRFGLSNLRYDKNGNITHLTRGGHLKEMPDWDKDDDFGTMDQLDYQYFDGSNRLRSVTDGILKNETSGKGEFVDGNKDGDDYVYDPNGNMTQDLNKGIKGATLAEKGIEYNHLNLPTKVSIDDGGANKGTISYIYDATGVKLRKNVLKQGETTPTATDYAGNFIYENGNLQFFGHGEGYTEPKNPDNFSQGYDYIYQYKDHLGNIRLSYSDADGNGAIDPSTEILDEKNYYPGGLQHKGYNTAVNGTYHPYGYNGKEENDELGLNTLDYGARNYDPALIRWMNLDPLAEKYTNLSPYSYVANNVVNAIDPDGRLIIFVGGLRLAQGNSDQRWWGKSGIYSSDVFNYWRTPAGETNSFGQRTDLVGTFARMHNDNNHLFTSCSSHWNSQASQRRSEGVRKAKKFYKQYQKGKVELADNETIKIVSHSQGGAHAAGFADQLMTYKDADGNSLFNVEVIYYITPHQPGDITHPDGPEGFQWSHFNDAVTNADGWMSWFNGGSGHAIIKNLSSINQFFEGTILDGEDATGATGNRNGHNVTDNQQNIINTLNDFCKQNPGKCKEIELVPNNTNND